MRPKLFSGLCGLAVAAVVAACAHGLDEDFGDDDDAAGGTGVGAGPLGGSTSTGTATGTTPTGAGGATTGAATGTATGTTPTGSGGAGAGTTTTSSGAGGVGGSGGSPSSCAHDVCDVGIALDWGCDPCVDQVCTYDDYCCLIEWDDLCVDEAVQFCGANCGGGSVGPGDLVITEIMNNPAAVSDANGEWFEVYNDSMSIVDLGGLVIRHQALAVDPNALHTIAGSVVLAPGDYAVLGNNADAATNGQVQVDYEYPSQVNLNNTADYLAIETAGQVLIDETSYDQASGLDPTGSSRNLDPPYLSAYDNDDDQHFCEATSYIVGNAGDHGTPGAQNDSCN